MKQTNGNQLTKTSGLDWKPLQEKDSEGIFIKSLMYDVETDRSPTILLKFEAGATYPLHDHPGGEEIFVLEGDIKLGKDELHAGDYLFTAVNNKHRVSTKNGCVVLLRAPEEVEIIGRRS
ncbi:MAG: cupin domain-containing protein [Acidobacteria bacterium]|nr:cupin domain-containing protein [Acidobacteriota bacterium]